MREFKFRAWDKEKMHYFDLSDTIYPSLEDKVMQFTGLKDFKGKEIYDGDIVRWGMINERSRECWHRYAVVEINPDIQFRILYYIIGKTGERKEPDGHIFHYGEFAYKETHKHLEIIGNIYEEVKSEIEKL